MAKKNVWISGNKNIDLFSKLKSDLMVKYGRSFSNSAVLEYLIYLASGRIAEYEKRVRR